MRNYAATPGRRCFIYAILAAAALIALFPVAALCQSIDPTLISNYQTFMTYGAPVNGN